jgi:hypothetical protein
VGGWEERDKFKKGAGWKATLRKESLREAKPLWGKVGGKKNSSILLATRQYAILLN